MGAPTDKFFYQEHEMLAIATARGFQVSDGLFEDWKEKGLLGEADRQIWPGRGGGSGSIALWSQPHLDLFLRILRYRQRKSHPVHIGPLCNLPVHRWLYYGDGGGVYLPQVKRAMNTWMTYQQNITEERRRRNITKLVTSYQGEKPEGKRELIDRLTAMGMFAPNQNPEDIEKRFDLETLQYTLETVVLDKAYPKKAKRGPYRERADLKTIFGTIYPLQFRALQERESLLALPDALWEWSRTVNLRSLLLYQREQPFMAADQRMGQKAPRATITNLYELACNSLLSYLGTAYLQNYPAPGWPGLDPHTWQKGEVISTIDTDIITASLHLPDGNPLSYLRNEVTISYKGEQLQFIVDLPLL